MAYASQSKGRKINWYRCPVKREALAALNQRSDWQGLWQAGGHLGLLALTGAAAWVTAGRLPGGGLPTAALLVLILLLHGTGYAFLLNAFHELCHKSVFKTNALNVIFLQIVSFIGWNNPVYFWTSHQEHHKYTLHPPDDLEVVLPVKSTLTDFLKSVLINPWDFYGRLKTSLRYCAGRLEGDWENHLFPEGERQALFRWARLHLIGQALLVAVSLYFGWWMLPVVITLAPFYGGGLLFLCNNTQHVGLQDKVPDFRLCTWTILLNPVVRFLYWQMNYHIEHHMYAAVPCYNLGKLHELIKDDLPPSPAGLVATWKLISEILRKQKIDPTYRYVAPLPAGRNR